MKVRIGAQNIGPGNTPELTSALRTVIVRKLESQTLVLSRGRLRAMAKALKAAGNRSMDHMMGSIVGVINRAGTNGFGSNALVGRSSIGYSLGNAVTGGAVQWKPLNYAKWKERRHIRRLGAGATERHKDQAARNSRFFVLDGGLKARLAASKLRFGGVQVFPGSLKKASGRLAEIKGDELRFQLARFTIKIMPRLAPALMPGLASQRWTDVGGSNKSFERAVFKRGDGIGVKLIGGRHVPYRPLVLPIVQFYAMVRIPYDLGRALTGFANTVSGDGTR